MIQSVIDNKQNYTSAITNAYVDYAANGLSQKEIWKDVNTKAEAKYLAELVSATVDSDNTFSVLVKYTDEKSLERVSEAIQKELKGRYKDIADRIGSHKLVLVSENYQVQTDSDLANSQSTVASLIKSYRDQISTLTSAMTEEQLKVVEGLSTKGIQTVYGENICYDAAAMREASEAGHVVLVEITDVSIYQEIEKELRILKDWNVNIAGCVGVE